MVFCARRLIDYADSIFMNLTFGKILIGYIQIGTSLLFLFRFGGFVGNFPEINFELHPTVSKPYPCP